MVVRSDLIAAATESGVSWKTQNAGGDHELQQVSFSDVEHGWALIGDDVLFATGDGSHTWPVVRPADAGLSHGAPHLRLTPCRAVSAPPDKHVGVARPAALSAA